jgi:sulfoxide reductase heme-binding subunit YedZ
MIHATGLWSVRFMLITLAITPIARMLDFSRLLLVRRIVGIAALAYALTHLGLYIADQKFVLAVVVSEIALRFYLTVGFLAVIGLAALGATSTDESVRRLGRRWKNLHRLAYPIAALAILHYFIQSKANVSESVFVAGLWVWLMLWRTLPEALRRRVSPHLGLAIVASLVTAGIEFIWYGISTNINPWRVLSANQSIDHGLRPAHWVFVVTALLFDIRRISPRSRNVLVNGSRSSGPTPVHTGNGS